MPMPSKSGFIKGRILIGITGGIGSGKSLAAHYFEKFGGKVINADMLTKELYRTDKELKSKLVKAFGEGILDDHGFVSGPNARNIIFSSEENIKRVNRLVHPFVIEAIRKIIEKMKSRIVFIESAIAFESGFYKKLDYIVMVYSPDNLRVQRVMMRDGAKKGDVENLMKLQYPEELKLKRADFILKNEGRKIDLKKAVKDLIKIIERIKH